MKWAKGCGAYYYTALRRWARMKNVNISKPESLGISFYVETGKNGIVQFVIGSRGTGCLRGSFISTFCGETKLPHDPERDHTTEKQLKRMYRKMRQEAWALAAPMFLQMTNQDRGKRNPL